MGGFSRGAEAFLFGAGARKFLRGFKALGIIGCFIAALKCCATQNQKEYD